MANIIENIVYFTEALMSGMSHTLDFGAAMLREPTIKDPITDYDDIVDNWHVVLGDIDNVISKETIENRK